MILWRIVYRPTSKQEWSPLKSTFYSSKGTAIGVLKRHASIDNSNWDDIEKVWVHPLGRIIYKIQHADIDWKDYGEK